MKGSSRKLTLEERLSLAAKKGKKKPKKLNTSPGVSPDQSPLPTRILPAVESDDKGHPFESFMTKDDEVNLTNDTGVVPIDTDTPVIDNTSPSSDINNDSTFLKSLINQEPWSLWFSADSLGSNPEELLKALRPHIQKLYLQNQHLQNENQHLNNENQPNKGTLTDSSLIKVIKEKDDIIDQLRQEGEKLSKTELRQSNLLKSMRKKASEQEDEMEMLQEELNIRNSLYEELHASNNIVLSDLKETEVKLAQLQQQSEQLIEMKASFLDKERQIEALQNELEEKRNELAESAKKYQTERDSLKSATEEQILGLESNLEQLRIEVEKAENSIPFTGSTDTLNLQEHCDHLSEELKSSKANSYAIEDALNGKVSNLESRLEETRSSLSQCNKNLQSSVEQNEKLKMKLALETGTNKKNENRISEFQSEISSLKLTIQNLTEDYDLLQSKYDIQRSHLERNIDQKNSEIGLQLHIPPSVEDEHPDSEVQKLEDNWIISRNSSSIQPIETPKILKEGFLTKDNSSIESQDEKYDLSLDIDDLPDEATDLRSLNPEYSSFRNTSSRNLNKYSSEVNSSARMNAQMVSKLGAEIRKFEVELSSLQNVCDRMQKEKNEAHDEILRLLEENEKVTAIKNENLCLSKQVEELRLKLDTSLQILGEKTELVEELQNDVADLKDMMRQQIQEMVKIQGI